MRHKLIYCTVAATVQCLYQTVKVSPILILLMKFFFKDSASLATAVARACMLHIAAELQLKQRNCYIVKTVVAKTMTAVADTAKTDAGVCLWWDMLKS